jgi:glycosyltransferase involved in cell wall biosynthesis
MKLTVIVPMLNEARVLPQLLAQLQRVQADGHQLLLVDGGSNDGSAQQARTAGFQVIESARGRARQMNAGVEHASGDVLLFLHADTRLPAGYWPAIQQGLAQRNTGVGAL